ncbi:related to circumsporozoite protein precursor [Phialocephala subalpina]|uniref:Related to circumsporozoite protein n=1 Tax=Phialocephala subalpina TaxID=576137 RepID=A0A1L7WQG4_9HELO|nr:related to circumsporozoite protein precursor [Phialocephala subalpina]
MYTQSVLLALLTAVAEARFGQEQGNGAITAIGALTDLGSSGQAATLAGGSIQFLLAAANPCGKLTQADNIIAELGTSDRAIAAARGLVAAEQNFNPFVVSIPSICSDPTLPTTAALRGVVPLIDPAVGGEAVENANSNTSIITPFNADGLSVAQVMVAQGFSNFTAVDVAGNKQAASALGTSASASTSSSNSTSNSASVSNSAVASVSVAASSSSLVACAGAATTFVTMTIGATASSSVAASTSVAQAASASSSSSASTAASGTCTGSGSTLLCSAPAAGAGAVTNAVTGNFDGFVASTNTSLDFGLCVPTMKFEAGLDGRATTAFTFQAIDPLVNKGQEEALNPSIITNRIHDQLTNVCGANQAAKDAAAAAQTMVAALGTRDNSTADAWNTALGFAGTNLNPDNAPQTGLVGHT